MPLASGKTRLARRISVSGAPDRFSIRVCACSPPPPVGRKAIATAIPADPSSSSISSASPSCATAVSSKARAIARPSSPTASSAGGPNQPSAATGNSGIAKSPCSEKCAGARRSSSLGRSPGSTRGPKCRQTGCRPSRGSRTRLHSSPCNWMSGAGFMGQSAAGRIASAPRNSARPMNSARRPSTSRLKPSAASTDVTSVMTMKSM